MNNLIDTYLSNYSTYKNGKVSFDCEYGELIFCKNKNNALIVYGIYVKPIYREKGLCKSILKYLIDSGKNTFKTLNIVSVLSNILYEYLLRFEYKDNKFKLTKNGFQIAL
jgi:hypothetical protein